MLVFSWLPHFPRLILAPCPWDGVIHIQDEPALLSETSLEVPLTDKPRDMSPAYSKARQ